MRFTVDIADQLASDLAAFVGKESLSPDELAALVQSTLNDRAAQFVERRADERRAEANEAIRAAAESRKAEIAAGISVEPSVV